MYPRFCAFAVALLVALAATACSGLVEPSKNQVETFTHTVQPGFGNSAKDSFNVSKSGEISITVTRMDPPVNVYFSVLYYQLAGCNGPLLQENDFAVVGRAVVSGPIQPGAYCVAVIDQGSFTAPETYTISVSHP